MNLNLLINNLTNPAFLFFLLGIIAVRLKSDLEIPANSAKFISLYLLFSIGFKGGQELSHETFTFELIAALLFGMFISFIIPCYTFYICKRFTSVENAAAIAASYGSVSAVTFVTAVSYLEFQQLHWHGHMVAVMALMEFPAIIAGLLLYAMYQKQNEKVAFKKHIQHALTNGSVLMIIGSLIIGYCSNPQQAEGIKPFTNDLFKGFLAIFLLDMGIESGKKLKSFFQYGWFPILFAILIPLCNGLLFTYLAQIISSDITNRFMFGVLAASASYIAVPAAMKLAIPKADAGLYLPMALTISFPINITVGMALYYQIAQL
jgi:hypothetical protein